MMVLHLRSLDETSLARRIYEEQKEKGWSGLARETKNICVSIQIEDCNITQMGKNKCREYVTAACHVINGERLRSGASSIQCARISTEKYGKKEYILHKRYKRPLQSLFWLN